MSKKRKVASLVVVAMVGVFVAFMCAGSFAVNPTAVTVSAAIAPTIQLNMPTTSVDFGGALTPGAVVNDTLSATVNSNRSWSLVVVKDHDLMNNGGAGPLSIPSSQLTYGAAGDNFVPTYVAPAGTEFGAVNTNVVQGNRGGNLQSTVTYALDITWDIEADTYTATHTYTATQP